ncbi:MAG: hypothetical protein FJ096_12655 [Deltaproteobacteria bacterium]|nr:hypothetical protein [Deltaproteobacteria bacterium]
MDTDRSPTHGLRLTLELERGASGASLRYLGAVRAAEGDIPVVADVSIDADQVAVQLSTLGMPLDDGLAKLAAPLIRAAVRSAVVRGQPPPRRVQRWREP